jgi:aldehyde dehydrogenase family 9 protein A1
MSEFKVPADLTGGLFFRNGKRVNIDGEKTFPVIEQRIGAEVGRCATASPALVDEVVKEARAAQKEWGNKTPLERGKILRKAAEIIRANHEDIARWEVRTNGKPLVEARIDIDYSADTLEYYGGIAAAVLKGDYLDIPGGGASRFAYTRREPLGVIGCIGAWNYPFQTCVWKVGPALAAGNAVVYKPSPFAPASPVLLGEILTAAGLPDGLYSVVQGEAETGEALCTNPGVNKLSFTGSVATGLSVQRAAAANTLKPCTLELGGKSEIIIFDDADISNAVNSAMMANFFNQGQVCTNATRVFVQRGILEKFTQELLKACEEKLKVGDPLNEETRVGANINEFHMNKILGFIESAKEEGGQILRGGVRVHPEGVENGYYIDPAVVAGLTDNAKAVREEIFGACLIILPFDTEEEAVARGNNTTFGLAAGVVTSDLARAHRIAAQLEAGSVFINTYNDCEVNVDFGGFKNSGHGRENCIDALKAHTQTKAVYVNLDAASTAY